MQSLFLTCHKYGYCLIEGCADPCLGDVFMGVHGDGHVALKTQRERRQVRNKNYKNKNVRSSSLNAMAPKLTGTVSCVVVLL